MSKVKTGLIHIYCGEGKGKTTAALGLCLRAHGRGVKVLWSSFLKDYDSGEFENAMPFDLYQGEKVKTFLYLLPDEERQRVIKEHRERLNFLFAKARKEDYGLLVLDELLGAIQTQAISIDQIIELIKQKPENLELVLTGRYAPGELLELADYVSEIMPIKHPFSKGIGPRLGIEN